MLRNGRTLDDSTGLRKTVFKYQAHRYREGSNNRQCLQEDDMDFMDVYDVSSKFSMTHLYCVDVISFSSYTGVLRVFLVKA